MKKVLQNRRDLPVSPQLLTAEVMLKFRGIRGVGAKVLGKCSRGSLEKKLAFPIQNLWDYFFEEPKNGVLFTFLQQKLWDLVYQQSNNYTKRARSPRMATCPLFCLYYAFLPLPTSYRSRIFASSRRMLM